MICVLVWLININHFSDEVFDGNVFKVRARKRVESVLPAFKL